MTDKQQPRSIETEVEIDAPIEAVWRALTAGEELSNWFPLEAKVKPGVGGSVWVSWGPGIAFESPIAVWEENKHLKLIYFEATPPEQAEEAKAKGMFMPFQLSVDYHLESRGGKTVLRLIHSGFAPDAGFPPIAVWEENKHLKLIYFEATPPEQAEEAKAKGMFMPFQLSVDYHLESRGGKTVLRLIHSGFAPDAGWDSQYDGTVRGWQFVLRGLGHYLENHPGTKRVVVEAKHVIEDLSLIEAWQRMMSESAMLAQGSVDALKPGDRYAFTMATGDELQGIVHLNNPPQDFCSTDEKHNNAFFLLKIDEANFMLPKPMVNLWLSTYDLPTEVTDALRERWDEMMKRLFAAAPTV